MTATNPAYQTSQPACASMIRAALFYRMAWCESHPALMLAGAAASCVLALMAVA